MLCSDALWNGQRTALGEIADVSTLVLTGSTIDEMVDEVLTSVTGPISLVGLSLGGIVAMAVAIAAPHRVERLAVLSATAAGPRPGQRMGWADFRERINTGMPVACAANELWPSLVSAKNSDNRRLRNIVTDMAEQVGSVTFLRQLSAQQSRVDQHFGLPTILCPSLVLAAANDALVPIVAMEKIANQISSAEFRILPGTGHLSPLESPAAIGTLLYNWILRTL